MMMVAWRTSSPRVLDGPKLVAQRSNAFLLPRIANEFIRFHAS